MTKRAKKHPQRGWRIALLFFLCPTLVWAELFQVEQISEPAGFVSQTEAIESGTTKASLSPTLSSNGYNFGYWEINGVRQAGSDGRSLTTVSSVISQATTYKAYYFSDSADTDNDGIKDWYEYRLFGDLSGGAADDPDGDGYSNKEESELGQDPLVVDEVQWGGVSGRLSDGFVYADTSMVLATIKSDPAGFVTESSNYVESNSTVTTGSLNGATNGYNFAYWSVNGERQAAVTGVSASKVSLDVNATTSIVAHYVPSSQDSDGDGVADWYELYNFGDLNEAGSDDPDGDGYTIAEELALGQESTVADEVVWGGVSGRLSEGFVYADTSMVLATIKSDPAGFVTESSNYVESNSTVTTGSLNGATNGYNFAYWSVNGERQAAVTGVSASKVSLSVNATTSIVAHYITSSQDSDGDGVADWYELYNFGDLNQTGSDDPDGDGYTIAEELALGQESTIEDSVEWGGVSGRLSDGILYFQQQNRPPSNLELNNTIAFLNKDTNQTIGTFIPTDPDDPNLMRTFQYRLLNQSGGEDNQKYNLLGNQLRASQTFTVEGNHSILVRVTDDENASFDKNFTIRAINPLRDDDGDGLGFEAELIAGTNPNNPDTDGDGASDGSEVSANKDPLDPNAYPNRPPRDISPHQIISVDYGATAPSGYQLHLRDIPNWNWQQKASISSARYSPHALVSSGERIYFIAGSNGSSPLSIIEAYDPTNDQWQQLASLNTARSMPAAAAIDQQVFVFGGKGPSNTMLSSGEKYDPDSNQWAQTSAIPQTLEKAGPIAHDGKVYLVGGGVHGTAQNTFYSYDPVANTWQTLPVLPFQGQGLSVFLFESKIWAIGHQKIASYDFSSNQWTIEGTLPFGGTQFVSWFHGGDYFLKRNGNEIYSINLSSNIMSFAGYFPDNAGLSSTVIHDGSIYVAGGSYGAYNDGNNSDKVYSSNLQTAFENLHDHYVELNSSSLISISENQPVGQVIGELNATDPDGDAITYHFVNGENNNSLFTLDTNGTLKTATTFDYESNASSYVITIQAKDELNATTEGNFTVTLLDVYEPSRQNHTVELNSTVGLEMIWVEPGTFIMGSPTSEVGRSNNEGLKSVNIPRGFFLGKYELTQAQYEAVMKGNTFGLSPNPSARPNKPNFPVERVSSNHTQTFLEILNKKQKDSGSLTYRWKYVLPTEAQWEYACRAGTTTAFSWGDSINSQHANYNDNIGRPVNVGQYEPNHWGFYDMHGNIAEWVSDRLISASKASARGGAYKSDYSSTRSAHRTAHEPTLLSERIGIRLAYEYIPNSNPSNLSSSHSLAFNENQPVGTVIGEFNATDPDGDAITYHFVNGENNNSLFTLDTNGTLKTATTFDYESNASSYTITVQAKDELNATTESNFTVTLLDDKSDNPPSDLWLSNAQINENTAVGTEVAQIVPLDKKYAYKAGQGIGSHVVILRNASHMGVQFIKGEVLNVTLIGNGGTVNGVTIYRPQVNKGPTWLPLTGRGDWWERVFPGVSLILESGNEGVSLDGQTGMLSVNRIFDYETDGASHSFSVRAEREGMHDFNKSFTLTITDIFEDLDKDGIPNHLDKDIDGDGFTNEEEVAYGSNPLDRKSVANQAPGFLDLNGTTILENQPAGTIVGQLIGKDLDTNATLIYSQVLEGKQVQSPVFVGPVGVVRTTGIFDYETNEHNYTLVARVTDEHNFSIERSFIIHLLNLIEDLDKDGIEDFYDDDIDGDGFTNKEEIAFGSDPLDAESLINRNPEDITMIGGRTKENEPVGTVVARFIGVDADGNESLTYIMAGYSNEWELMRLSQTKDSNESKEENPDLKDYNSSTEVVSDGNKSGIYESPGDSNNSTFSSTLDENTDKSLSYPNPFVLSPRGVLRTSRSLDFERDPSLHFVKIRVVDEYNASIDRNFSIRLVNVIEDSDGDGTEDAFDEDTDGDGFSNQAELAEGTNPKDKYSYPKKPILETAEALFDENGSFILRGSVLENGQGKITDFGFVLSSGISLDREKSTVYWIRGEGIPKGFKLNGTESPFENVMYFRAWAKNVAGYGIGQVKKISIPEAPQLWWGDVIERPGGWKISDWFGTFKYYEQGWVYHARLGWLYASAADEKSLWLWKEGRGWLWTNQSAWPYLWWNKSKNWLYLVPSKPGERIRFYDYSTESYR